MWLKGDKTQKVFAGRFLETALAVAVGSPADALKPGLSLFRKQKARLGIPPPGLALHSALDAPCRTAATKEEGLAIYGFDINTFTQYLVL